MSIGVYLWSISIPLLCGLYFILSIPVPKSKSFQHTILIIPKQFPVILTIEYEIAIIRMVCLMPKKILIVDDNIQLRSMLKSYLVQEGFTIDTASNGKEALFVAR